RPPPRRSGAVRGRRRGRAAERAWSAWRLGSATAGRIGSGCRYVAGGGDLAEPSVRITRETFVRFGRALRRLFQGAEGRRARLLFAPMFMLLLTANGMNVVNSYVGRDFMTSVESRDPHGFLQVAFLYSRVVALSTCTTVL